MSHINPLDWERFDDREDRTPILLDRAFMKRLNVMVNPQRKYVITTKYSID